MAGESILSLNPQDLRDEAGVCTTAASDLGDVVTELNKISKEIQAGWEGAASDAYVSILLGDGVDSINMMSQLCERKGVQIDMSESASNRHDPILNSAKLVSIYKDIISSK